MTDARARFKQYYRSVRLGRKEVREQRQEKPGFESMKDLCNAEDYHEPTMTAAIRAAFGLSYRLRRGGDPQAVEIINRADAVTPRDARVAPRAELIQIYLRAVRYRKMEWERGSNYRLNSKYHIWEANLRDLEAQEKAFRYGLTILPPITLFHAKKPGDAARAWQPTLEAYERQQRLNAAAATIVENQEPAARCAMARATDEHETIFQSEAERMFLSGEHMEANEYVHEGDDP